MAIDRSSPEYLFGQIMARLNEGDKIMQGLAGEVNGVSKALSSLPCAVHGRRLDELNGWKQDCENQNVRQDGFRIKFWQGIVFVLVTVAVNALVSLLLGAVL